MSICEKKFARTPAGVALDLSVVSTDRASIVTPRKIYKIFSKKSIKWLNLSVGEKKFARAPAGVAPDLSVVSTDRASMVTQTKFYKIFFQVAKEKKNFQKKIFTIAVHVYKFYGTGDHLGPFGSI